METRMSGAAAAAVAAAAAALSSPLLSVMTSSSCDTVSRGSSRAVVGAAVTPSCLATVAATTTATSTTSKLSVLGSDGINGGANRPDAVEVMVKPEPRVLGGREIVDQRGKTRLVGPFYCSVCYKQFPHKSLTEIHLQCHMEKRLPCPFCDKMFKNKYVLKYHVEGAHNQTLGDPSPQLRRRLEKRSLNAVTCFCGLTFETMNSYNEHMRTHQHHPSHNGNHRSTVQQEHQAVTCHPCPMCKGSFANLYQLVKHMEIHNNNGPASSSDSSVATKKIRLVGGATLQITPATARVPPAANALASMLSSSPSSIPVALAKSSTRRSVSKSSTKVVVGKAISQSSTELPTRRFECEMCEKKFSQLPLYRGHLQNAHQLYLMCLECYHVAGDVNEMSQHMENAHPQFEVHPCSVCGRCFTDGEAARDHLEAHKNGLADFSGCFQCTYCEALYDSERECVLHEYTHPVNARTLLR